MYNFQLKSLMRARFARDEKGSASVEAALMVTAIFVVMVSVLALLDLTRLHGQHQKAAYTIADMVSRETLPIDNAYLTGTHALLNTLTRDPQESTVRVTIVRYDANNKIFKLDWSKTSGFGQPLTNHQVRNWSDRLPVMLHNERMIVVETRAMYDPPFMMGLGQLGQQTIDQFIFTRPRYSPQVLWTDIEPDFAGS
ncbi:hypothetical protein OS189_08795 [Sulfitobacter sp. F26169L]|uniref:TadE/TadG family type IV pilus assembly protein n=1 Tax=Sulfitobacter sp. F26169L TaxID=2996015 RepID=UPI002260D296|nr:hypothetical protein [Sulfitobacter sp. F26169L]MCX7566437.1 hypothetical protein [Sulfitobacter sp. F26169L]